MTAGVGQATQWRCNCPTSRSSSSPTSGVLKAGGAVVPLNVLLRAPEVAFHLGDSRARVLITWEGVLAEALEGTGARPGWSPGLRCRPRG